MAEDHEIVADPGIGADQAPDTLVELATRVHGHIAAERALFALTGQWSADPGDPEVQAFFAAQSAFHAWRAEGWEQRRPRSVDPSRPVSGADVADGWWSAALADASSADPGDRLGVWANALAPALVGRYRSHRGALAPAADHGVARWLGIAEADLLSGWADAQALLLVR